jgi:hypothetical protein
VVHRTICGGDQLSVKKCIEDAIAALRLRGYTAHKITLYAPDARAFMREMELNEPPLTFEGLPLEVHPTNRSCVTGAKLHDGAAMGYSEMIVTR